VSFFGEHRGSQQVEQATFLVDRETCFKAPLESLASDTGWQVAKLRRESNPHRGYEWRFTVGGSSTGRKNVIIGAVLKSTLNRRNWKY